MSRKTGSLTILIFSSKRLKGYAWVEITTTPSLSKSIKIVKLGLAQQPITEIRRGPVTIPKLTPRLGMISKSSIGSPSGPCSNPYCSRKGGTLVLGGPEQTINKSNR